MANSSCPQSASWRVVVPMVSQRQLVSVRFMQIIMEQLKQSYVFKLTEHHGTVLQNGTATYAIGDLAHGDADMSVTDFTPFQARLKAVDYATVPVSTGRFEFVFNRDALLINTDFEWHHIFDTVTWLFLATTIMLCSTASQILTRFHRSVLLNVRIYYWLLLIAATWPLRLIFNTHILRYHIQIVNMPFETMEGMIQAITSGQFTYMETGGGSQNQVLQDSHLPVYKALRRALNLNPPVKVAYGEVVSELITHRHFFLYAENAISYYCMTPEANHVNCRSLEFVARRSTMNIYNLIMYSRTFPKCSRRRIDQALIGLHEHGFVRWGHQRETPVGLSHSEVEVLPRDRVLLFPDIAPVLKPYGAVLVMGAVLLVLEKVVRLWARMYDIVHGGPIQDLDQILEGRKSIIDVIAEYTERTPRNSDSGISTEATELYVQNVLRTSRLPEGVEVITMSLDTQVARL